jgi:hypothetical protein
MSTSSVRLEAVKQPTLLVLDLDLDLSPDLLPTLFGAKLLSGVGPCAYPDA